MTQLKANVQTTKRYTKTPFLAVKEMTCKICNEKIQVNEHYYRIEPKRKKLESFITCRKCADGVK
jgi:uncharacterized protein with PIN domain